MRVNAFNIRRYFDFEGRRYFDFTTEIKLKWECIIYERIKINTHLYISSDGAYRKYKLTHIYLYIDLFMSYKIN